MDQETLTQGQDRELQLEALEDREAEVSVQVILHCASYPSSRHLEPVRWLEAQKPELEQKQKE